VNNNLKKNTENVTQDLSPKDQNSINDQFSIRQNDIRAFICLAATGTLVANFGWPTVSVVDWVFAVLALCYSVCSYIYLKRLSSSVKYAKAFDIAMTADAAVIGMVLGYSSFNILPAILFATMIQFNSLIHGGLRKWAADNLALGFGIAVIFAIKQPEWVIPDGLNMNIISLIGVLVYFCAYAVFANKRIQKLERMNKKMVQDQNAYRFRTYKLSRYLTPTVWKAINEGRETDLISERKRITVFFSDIQGFSAMTEELEAESLTDLLNTYLTEMANIAHKHGGTIDKFMGDGVMVLFGDNRSEGLKKDCLRCVSMAIDMRKKMKELQTQWHDQGIKLQIRMGINTGFCTVGSFGSTNHYMDYTVLGTHVNLASRLESAASAGEILISHETWSLIKDVVLCSDKGEIRAKGFSNPIKVYQVIDYRKDLGKHQSYFEENTEGFSMHLDLEKIRNYDKQKVIRALQQAATHLRDKVIK